MSRPMFASMLHPIFTLLVMIIALSSVGMIVFHRLPLRVYRVMVMLSTVGAVVLWSYLTFDVHVFH